MNKDKIKSKVYDIVDQFQGFDDYKLRQMGLTASELLDPNSTTLKILRNFIKEMEKSKEQEKEKSRKL